MRRKTGKKRCEALRDANVVLVLGSQNSSNSQRLAELARETGVGAHLVDGAADIDPAWFGPSDTVLVTAGAGARNRSSRSASISSWPASQPPSRRRFAPLREVYFPLPRELRSAGQSPVTTGP